MAGKRKTTAREKKIRAQTKRRLQEEGILPPDKPRLNRKRYIEEARTEWDGRDRDCYLWDRYIMEALAVMMAHREHASGRRSLEAVGAAKVLKIAVRFQKFSEKLKKEGRREYEVGEKFDYIKDVLEA